MELVKKRQKINIKVDPEFGDIAPGEIRNALFRKYSLWNKVVPVENFPGDPIGEVQVLFFATDEKAAEIEASLRTAYQFTD
ncbi:MAG: hypothetical protein ACLTXM_02625 [Enterococcus sp.]